MDKKDIICVTKRSVDELIEILDQTIELLEINNELLTTQEDINKNYLLEIKAKSEREIYRKVKNIMENRGHTTLCLSSEFRKG